MVLRIMLAASVCLLLAACGDGSAEIKKREKKEQKLEPMTVDEAKDLFIRQCESCHGIDGKKQLSGAADLSVTKKSDAEILQTILNGNDKGMMPYADLLTEREEKGLVLYVKSLQQQ